MVEIADYLRITRGRVWLLVLVPAFAIGTVAIQELQRPALFRATSTVAAPAVVGGVAQNQYSGTNGIRNFVSDFTAAISSPVIIDPIADEYGMSSAEVRAGVQTAPVGASSIIDVTFVTEDRDRAEPIVQALASRTVTFLFATELELAQQTFQEAQAAVEEVNGRIDQFRRQIGRVFPERDYALISQELSTLQLDQIDAEARGDIALASRLSAAIQERRQQLDALGPQASAYELLLEERDRAVGRRDVVAGTLERAKAQAQATDPDQVVTVSNVRQSSKRQALITAIATATGAGLFMAVGLVVLLEVLAHWQVTGRSSVRRPDAPAQTST